MNVLGKIVKKFALRTAATDGQIDGLADGRTDVTDVAGSLNYRSAKYLVFTVDQAHGIKQILLFFYKF